MKAVSTDTVEPYPWGGVSEGWRLVDQPGLAVIEERVPPGAGEQPHRHHQARQFFYLLTGQAELHTPDGSITLQPGTGLEIPPGLPHRLHNPGPSDARFLVISAPNTKNDRQNLPLSTL